MHTLFLETFRDAASKSQLPENLIKFLSESDLNTRLQILRASGNLSIDHGKILVQSCDLLEQLTITVS